MAKLYLASIQGGEKKKKKLLLQENFILPKINILLDF